MIFDMTITKSVLMMAHRSIIITDEPSSFIITDFVSHDHHRFRNRHIKILIGPSSSQMSHHPSSSQISSSNTKSVMMMVIDYEICDDVGSSLSQ